MARAASAGLSAREVGPAEWPDLEQLFQARGGPFYCWCMAWRPKPKEDRSLPAATRNAARKALMKGLVDAGVPVGVLAYQAERPVGWCSVAPLSTFRRLGGPAPDNPDEVWAISCFFVPRALRGQGIPAALLDGAIGVARRHGARLLQGTPAEEGSPSYRFMGRVAMFAEAGFAEVGRAGHRRMVMQLDLTDKD